MTSDKVRYAHLVNDYERERTWQLRVIRANLLLLENGLHALRSGSTSVTDEYLVRAIDSNRAELERLKALPSASGTSCT